MAGSAGGAQDLASIQKVPPTPPPPPPTPHLPPPTLNPNLACIQKVVDALPELNRQKREVAKHVAICSDLSRLGLG